MSKEVDETEDRLLEGHFVAALKTELSAAMKTEVESAVGAVKMEILCPTVEETLRNISLDGDDVVGKKCKTSPTNSLNMC